MSCSDILLSFLADAGEDWAESFIFPDADGSIDVSNYLLKSDYIQEACLPPSPAKSCSSDNLTSADEEDKEFQEALDAFDFTDEEYASGEYLPFGLEGELPAAPIPTFNKESSSKKRKQISEEIEGPSKKIIKSSAEDKIASVVSLLQKYKIKREEEIAYEKTRATRRFKFGNSIGIAETFLQSVLGCTNPSTPNDLLKLSSPSATFQSKALSSLVAQAQDKKNQMKLSAWVPVKQATSQFPEIHTGVGQIAASSRAFSSAISDFLTHSTMHKLKFSVSISKESTISSKYGDKISAPFVWKSEGMIALGFPEELEFNGLIRCSFVREGISQAQLFFDACKIVRQCQILSQPLTVRSIL